MRCKPNQLCYVRSNSQTDYLNVAGIPVTTDYVFETHDGPVWRLKEAVHSSYVCSDCGGIHHAMMQECPDEYLTPIEGPPVDDANLWADKPIQNDIQTAFETAIKKGSERFKVPS